MVERAASIPSNENVNLHSHSVKPNVAGMENRQDRPSALQDRSLLTQDLLCDAAEELLREGGLSRCTIQEVAARSGRSAGSVYRRFGDKDGMIEAVIERFLERALEKSETHFETFALRRPNLSSRLKVLVDGAVKGRRREWRLVEALREVAANSSNPTLQASFERARRAALDLAKRSLRECASEISRPDKEGAIEFAMTTLNAVMQPSAISDRVVRSELHAMLLSYLTMSTGQGPERT
jgi:AcrR family transcriptional regulator